MKVPFLKDESGAVTVDWVVITAALVGLGLSAAMLVRNGSAELGGDVSNSLSSASVVDLGQLGAGGYYWLNTAGTYSSDWWDQTSQAMYETWSDSALLDNIPLYEWMIERDLAAGETMRAATTFNQMRAAANAAERRGLGYPERNNRSLSENWQRVLDAKPCDSSWNASEC